MLCWERIRLQEEKLDLAFDIDRPESILSSRFEKLGTFAGKESKFIALLFKKILTLVVDNELASLVIGFKAKFLSNESNTDIWLISKYSLALMRSKKSSWNLRSTDIGKRSQTFTNDEHIHKICAHVRSIEVQSEESMIVAQGQC